MGVTAATGLVSGGSEFRHLGPILVRASWLGGGGLKMSVTRSKDRHPRPQAFYTYFYIITTPVVSAWKNYCSIPVLYLELSRSPNGHFNHFWIQVTVSLLKRPHGGFRSKTAATARSRFRSEAVTNF
jgi:hypothetical protein